MTDVRSSAPADQPEPGPAGTIAAEPRRERLARHAHRARLYAIAVLVVLLLAVIVALTAANLRTVKLDWVVGSTHASLVWVILAATALGWVLGILTSILFRFRTRRHTNEPRVGTTDEPATPG